MIHQVLDQHFSSCLQFYKNKFWTGFRWMAIKIESPAEKPYFFKDYIWADNFCSKMTGYKIVSLSRAIKLLLNTPRVSINPKRWQEFEEIVLSFPITLQIAKNSAVDFLELNEYIPIEWHYKYNPLSICNTYHILALQNDNKKAPKPGNPKIIFASSVFAEAIQYLHKTIRELRCKKTDRRIFLIGQMLNQQLDIRSLETIFTTAIAFYYCDLGLSRDMFFSEIIQVHNPTDWASASYKYFIKFDMKKKEINFFSSQLKRCKPGLPGQQYSSVHFLDNAISRYGLVPPNYSVSRLYVYDKGRNYNIKGYSYLLQTVLKARRGYDLW